MSARLVCAIRHAALYQLLGNENERFDSRCWDVLSFLRSRLNNGFPFHWFYILSLKRAIKLEQTRSLSKKQIISYLSNNPKEQWSIPTERSTKTEINELFGCVMFRKLSQFFSCQPFNSELNCIRIALNVTRFLVNAFHYRDFYNFTWLVFQFQVTFPEFRNCRAAFDNKKATRHMSAGASCGLQYIDSKVLI